MATKNKLIISLAMACKVMGYDPKMKPNLSWMPAHFRDSVLATLEMMIIIEAQNKQDNWQPDYRPGKQNWKYSPWPGIEADDKRPSGFGFSDSDYVSSDASTVVGSRLCVGSRERTLQLFDQHKKIYARMWLIPYNQLPKKKQFKVKKSK
jgi:hypothetical protein